MQQDWKKHIKIANNSLSEPFVNSKSLILGISPWRYCALETVTIKGRHCILGIRLPSLTIKRGGFVFPIHSRGGFCANLIKSSMSFRFNFLSVVFEINAHQCNKRSISRRYALNVPRLPRYDFKNSIAILISFV